MGLKASVSLLLWLELQGRSLAECPLCWAAIGEPILFLKFSKALLIAVMGENEAQRKWEVQTILMPLSCMTGMSSFPGPSSRIHLS